MTPPRSPAPRSPAPRRPARRPRPAAVTARGAALALLSAVLDQGRPLDDAFDSAAAGLSGRDRAFARLLAAATLRHLGGLDGLIDPCLTRPLPRAGTGARHLLRLGATQLVILGTPPHAAVAATVAEARARPPLVAYAGLINAVLRRLASADPATLAARIAADPLALWPAWLADQWRRTYGAETAAALALACTREAPLDLTLRGRPGDPPAATLAAGLGATLLPGGSLRLAPPVGPDGRDGSDDPPQTAPTRATDPAAADARSGAVLARWPGFAQGQWWVQDAAAALPVRLILADPSPADPSPASPRPADPSPADPAAAPLHGWLVIDLCAAPGGKTLQLAAAGARVLAIDRSAARLARLTDNLARTDLAAAVTPLVADATADPATWGAAARPWIGRADLVLVDAPCTATGTLRRHPDAAWIKRPTDAAALAGIQDRLLDRAHGLVRPGGTLVYCVCSLDPAEGAPRIAAALARHGDLDRHPVSPATLATLDLPADARTANGDLRLLPCHWAARGGLDGFFIARLIRRPADPIAGA